jgi:hypothetical protein
MSTWRTRGPCNDGWATSGSTRPSEAAANETTAHELVQERLRALLGTARADLDKRIEEEVSAASRRGAADVKELRDSVLGRLEESLERWSKEHDAALDVLMREADGESVHSGQIRRAGPRHG